MANDELTGYRWSVPRVIRVDLTEIDEQLMRPVDDPPRTRKRRP